MIGQLGRLVLLGCALPALSLALAARPASGQAASASLKLDPVVLSPDERAEIDQGRIIIRAVANPGLKGRTYEAVGTLPGTLDEARRVILDYRHYDEFMPRVERIVVSEEGPTVSIIEEYLKLPLGVRRRFRLRYSLRELPEGFRVDWVKVPWPEVPLSQSVTDTSGHWQVGQMSEGGLLAVYYVYTEPGRVPLGLKGLALSLSKRDLPKIIERVRDRIRAPAAPVPVKDRPPAGA